MMTSGDLPGELAGIKLADAVFDTNLVPPNMWRDTVFIENDSVTNAFQLHSKSSLMETKIKKTATPFYRYSVRGSH